MFYLLLKTLKLEEPQLKILKKKCKPREERVGVLNREIVLDTSEKKKKIILLLF